MRIDEFLQDPELCCALPYKWIGDMLQRVGETQKSGNEASLSFCAGEHGFSAYGTTGLPYEVNVGICFGKEQPVGHFHTHPSGGGHEKSLTDWTADLEGRERVSCLGFPSKVRKSGGVGKEREEPRRTVVCDSFNKSEPGWHLFRQQWLPAARRGRDVNRSLVKKLFEERRSSTPEEYAEYSKHKDVIREMVKDGEWRHLIKRCDPDCFFGEFRVADIDALVEQAPRPGPPPPVKREKVLMTKRR